MSETSDETAQSVDMMQGATPLRQPHPGQVIRVRDAEAALEDVREHVGEKSQAAFVLEALLKACRG